MSIDRINLLDQIADFTKSPFPKESSVHTISQSVKVLTFLVFFTPTPIYLESETKQVKLFSFLMRTCFGGF